MGSPGVLGSFGEPPAAAGAIRALRDRGFAVRAAMAAPFEDVVAALGRPRSAIDRVTLPAALAGLGCGAVLTAGTALAWPIVTGEKAIVSVPPFAIISFEVAVLLGSLANLAAFAVCAWRGRSRGAFPPELAFPSEGVGVLASGKDAGEAERILRAHGAGEVRRVS